MDNWPKTRKEEMLRADAAYEAIPGNKIMSMMNTVEYEISGWLEDQESFKGFEVHMSYEDFVQAYAIGIALPYYQTLYRQHREIGSRLVISSIGYWKEILAHSGQFSVCAKLVWYAAQGKIKVPKIPKPREKKVVDEGKTDEYNRHKDRPAARAKGRKKKA